MSWPTPEATAQFAYEQKVTSEIPIDYSHIEFLIGAAIDEWQTETKWSQFLAGEDDEVRTFDADGSPILRVPCGYLDIAEISIGGSVMTPESYLPVQVVRGPFRMIRFASAIRSGTQIRVVGTFGYCDSIPADVQHAVMSRVATQLAASAGGVAGALTEVRQGEVTLKGNAGGQAAEFDRAWASAVRRYRRGAF